MARWIDDGSKVLREGEGGESTAMETRVSRSGCAFDAVIRWTNVELGPILAATKQTIRRCSAFIVLLTSIVHRVIESSSRHPSFSPLTRNSLWMDDDPIPKQSNSCLVGIWREQQELLVVYALHVSAWVTNGRSYFGRKSGLTRDAVQRLLLLDDKYLTSFFLKKKSAKIPRECNKILTRDKVGP